VCADDFHPDYSDVLRALPSGLAEHVVHVFGERGRAWLDGLPAVVAGLAGRWGLRLGSRRYPGGTHSLVLAATRADRSPALLKVPVQDEENRHEAAALRCYAGDGSALLYAADPETGALLMERMEPGAPLLEHPDRELAIDIACALLRRLRRPVPAGHPFASVPALVERWSAGFPVRQARHGMPVPVGLMREVMATVESLRAPDGPERLVNRDAHLGNVLAAEREPWLLIDPKPLAGEAAFDGGWLLIDVLSRAPSTGNARWLAARVADGLGVAPERVRAWALARVAENVFWDLDCGDDPDENLALLAVLSGAAGGRGGRG